MKEIRYYDENGELSSDHLMKCAIIRFPIRNMDSSRSVILMSMAGN